MLRILTTTLRILAAPPGSCRRRGATLRYNDLQGNNPLALIDLDDRHSFALLIISAASFWEVDGGLFPPRGGKESGREALRVPGMDEAKRGGGVVALCSFHHGNRPEGSFCGHEKKFMII